MPLLAEAQQWRGAAKIAPAKLRAGDAEVGSQTRNVITCHIDKTLLLTASDAPGLALEAHARVYREIRETPVRTLRESPLPLCFSCYGESN